MRAPAWVLARIGNPRHAGQMRALICAAPINGE
jgi:hypothetical protein